MAEQLEVVKALRAEASAAVADAKVACASAQAQAVEVCRLKPFSLLMFNHILAQVVDSLKRKRDTMEVDGTSSLLIDAPGDVVAPAPKRRRAMRVVSVVARTATVATLGAVAAWSALAFS